MHSRVIIVLYNVLSADSNTNRLQLKDSDYFDLVEMIRACAKRKALQARTAEASPRRFASSQPRPNKKPPGWVVFCLVEMREAEINARPKVENL